MTFHPHSIGPVPEETARIAHAACPKGNPYLHMRDLLGTLYDDQLFATLFPPQIRQLQPGCGRFLLWRSFAGSGSNSFMPPLVRSSGAATMTCLQLPC